MADSRFDERVEAFANYYSQRVYDTLDSKTFMYQEEVTVQIIKEFMLIFLEQCIINVAPITKET